MTAFSGVGNYQASLLDTVLLFHWSLRALHTAGFLFLLDTRCILPPLSYCHIASVLGLLYIPPRPLGWSLVVAHTRLVRRGVVYLGSEKNGDGVHGDTSLVDYVATGAIWYILMAE
jgi:hypothetical protein